MLLEGMRAVDVDKACQLLVAGTFLSASSGSICLVVYWVDKTISHNMHIEVLVIDNMLKCHLLSV